MAEEDVVTYRTQAEYLNHRRLDDKQQPKLRLSPCLSRDMGCYQAGANASIGTLAQVVDVWVSGGFEDHLGEC